MKNTSSKFAFGAGAILASFAGMPLMKHTNNEAAEWVMEFIRNPSLIQTLSILVIAIMCFYAHFKLEKTNKN